MSWFRKDSVVVINIKKLIVEMRHLFILPLLAVVISCAPPLEDECYSTFMDQWDAAVISEKDGEKFRFISTENSDGVLDQQYYPDTKDGKLYLSLMSGLNAQEDKIRLILKYYITKEWWRSIAIKKSTKKIKFVTILQLYRPGYIIVEFLFIGIILSFAT